MISIKKRNKKSSYYQINLLSYKQQNFKINFHKNLTGDETKKIKIYSNLKLNKK